MKRIKFRYKDQYTRGNWSYQEGEFKTVQDAIEWYGLGKDCEYEIISVEEV